MILIDFSSISYATVIKTASQIQLTPTNIRHSILQRILYLYKKHKDKYGPELIICCDSNKSSWRKRYYPYYKANRKRAREMIKIDWQLFFETQEELINELREYFPYKIYRVDNVEADDIISYVIKVTDPATPILVISQDKDFFQFQLHYKNVDQYIPDQDRFYKVTFQEALDKHMEHIIRGDAADGIPNVFSDDDALVNPDKRQSRATKKRIEDFIQRLENKTLTPEEETKINRNRILIDLKSLPEDIETLIENELNTHQPTDKSKLFKYLLEHQLDKIIKEIKHI